LLNFDCPWGQSKLSNEGLRSDLNARHTASFGNRWWGELEDAILSVPCAQLT
jgi:hypothetical protein